MSGPPGRRRRWPPGREDTVSMVRGGRTIEQGAGLRPVQEPAAARTGSALGSDLTAARWRSGAQGTPEVLLEVQRRVEALEDSLLEAGEGARSSCGCTATRRWARIHRSGPVPTRPARVPPPARRGRARRKGWTRARGAARSCGPCRPWGWGDAVAERLGAGPAGGPLRCSGLPHLVRPAPNGRSGRVGGRPRRPRRPRSGEPGRSRPSAPAGQSLAGTSAGEARGRRAPSRRRAPPIAAAGACVVLRVRRFVGRLGRAPGPLPCRHPTRLRRRQSASGTTRRAEDCRATAWWRTVSSPKGRGSLGCENRPSPPASRGCHRRRSRQRPENGTASERASPSDPPHAGSQCRRRQGRHWRS